MFLKLDNRSPVTIDWSALLVVSGYIMNVRYSLIVVTSVAIGKQQVTLFACTPRIRKLAHVYRINRSKGFYSEDTFTNWDYECSSVHSEASLYAWFFVFRFTGPNTLTYTDRSIVNRHGYANIGMLLICILFPVVYYAWFIDTLSILEVISGVQLHVSVDEEQHFRTYIWDGVSSKFHRPLGCVHIPSRRRYGKKKSKPRE